MDASINNQFSAELSANTNFSGGLYRKLLSAYAELPFVTMERIADISSPELGELPLVFMRYAPPSSTASRKLKLLITAGIHGDEPAGVLALYKYVMSLSLRELPVEVYAFPCINPVGLLQNSRASSGHFDLNRQMTRNSIAPEVRAFVSTLDGLCTPFDAAFDLQEDNPAVTRDTAPDGSEADAFYLYESNFDPLRASIGTEISRAVAKAGIAVASQRSIYGERSLNGVIQRGMERDREWDVERFLTMNVTNHAITLRTPVSAPLSERVKAQTTALESGIQVLMRALL